MKLNLKYKASTIAKVERESAKSFFEMLEALERPSVSGLEDLLKAGGFDGDESRFDEIFDEGIEKITFEIAEGLSESGFLPKEARKQIKNALENLQGEVSPKSGKTAKSKQ